MPCSPPFQESGVRLQKPQGFSQRPCAFHTCGADPIPERSLGTVRKGKQSPTKKAPSDIIHNFVVTTLRLRNRKKIQEIETEIKDSILTETENKDFMQQKKTEKFIGYYKFPYLF